jgi:diguanylate cyclase (GGDEF)-like protein
VATVAADHWLWLPGLVQAAGVGAAAIGVVRHEPGNRVLWWAMIAGGAGWTIAATVVRGAGGPDAAGGSVGSAAQEFLPTWATGLLLGSYALVACSLLLLTRRQGERLTDAMDAVTVCAALLVLSWTFAVRPLLVASWELTPGAVLSLGHAVVSGVLVVAVLRFLAIGSGSRPASALLSLAGLALVLADVALAAPLSARATVASAATLAAGLWPVALGAAALHPSSIRLWPEAFAIGPAVSRRRLAAFGLLACFVPATPLAVTVLAQRAGYRAPLVWYAPVTCAAVVVSVLIVVRLGLIARFAEKQAQVLRRALRQRSELEQELRHQATHDSLTGLANRAVLLGRLDRILAGGQARGALTIVNLDGFKDVNDLQGHDVGDQVLVQAAERLREATADSDLVARLSGDEFAVLTAPGTDHTVRVRRALEALRPGFRAGPGEVHLTGTAGLLDLADSATSTDALRDADLALTAAKRVGKNQLVPFHPAMRTERVLRGELATGLRRALASEGLTVHYQPVVDLADGRMAAVEALVRWIGDDGQQIPPMQFIPVAEETGLIVEVGEFVLRRACSDARRWHESHGVTVAVNVSAHQLREPGFADAVLAVLSETGLPASALVLELTETTMITDVEETAALERLRTSGVRIAIDDFGVGYSSLSYLVRLPVDILKIDRAFTSPAPNAVPDHWAFVGRSLNWPTACNS